MSGGLWAKEDNRQTMNALDFSLPKNHSLEKSRETSARLWPKDSKEDQRRGKVIHELHLASTTQDQDIETPENNRRHYEKDQRRHTVVPGEPVPDLLHEVLPHTRLSHSLRIVPTTAVHLPREPHTKTHAREGWHFYNLWSQHVRRKLTPERSARRTVWEDSVPVRRRLFDSGKG